MADTEQEGTPSATAGGASAPILDLSAFEKAGRLLAAAWLEQQAARAAYWRGLLGGLSAEQESSATQEVDRSTCPNCWGDLPADPRDAEMDRMRGELCRIRDIALVVLNVLPDDDDRSAVELVREILVTVGPEKLRRDKQFRDLVAERDRKRRELADVTAERDDYAGRLRDTDAAYAKVTAERDRLRQDLDFIAGQPQGSNPYWQQRSKRVEAERDVMGEALATMRGVLATTEQRLLAKPVDPRRWGAGDPEPEIGTTVWRRAERYRRSSNGWHRVDIHTGYASWAWILSVGSEIVEAVDRG